MSQQPPPNFNFDTSGGKDNSASKQPEPQSAKKLLSSLSATAGAAAKLVVLQTERTKLTTMTLPAAYRALGKDCVQQKRHLESAPELMQQLRSVMGELKALSDAATAQPAAQSLTDKAKAVGKQAADLARQKQLGMKRDALIADIGKAIHDQQGDASGQTELVAPIRDALTRIPQLDADISRLSEIGKGSFLTPKRLLIGGGIAAVLLVGVMVMMAGSWMFGGKSSTSDGNKGGSSGGGGKGYAQRVLDTDPKLFTGTNVKTHENIVKLFTPKHPAGTKADAIQAISMLTPKLWEKNPPRFIRSNDGPFGDGLTADFFLSCNPALYNAVFGSPENLRTVKEYDSFARRTVTYEQWLIRCSDGDLRCGGHIFGGNHLLLNTVFKELPHEVLTAPRKDNH